jgi:hypothetical protein
MSHYDKEFEKAIQEASVSIRNETRQEGNVHISNKEDLDSYINQTKSAYINGDLTEEQLLEGLNPSTAHADLVQGYPTDKLEDLISDPWDPMYSPDEDFSNTLDNIRVTSNNEYVRGLLDDVLAYGDVDSCSRDVLLTIKKELLK